MIHDAASGGEKRPEIKLNVGRQSRNTRFVRHRRFLRRIASHYVSAPLLRAKFITNGRATRAVVTTRRTDPTMALDGPCVAHARLTPSSGRAMCRCSRQVRTSATTFSGSLLYEI